MAWWSLQWAMLIRRGEKALLRTFSCMVVSREWGRLCSLSSVTVAQTGSKDQLATLPGFVDFTEESHSSCFSPESNCFPSQTGGDVPSHSHRPPAYDSLPIPAFPLLTVCGLLTEAGARFRQKRVVSAVSLKSLCRKFSS